MINKLFYLTKVSLKRKMGTKWFIVANIVMAMVVIGLMNIDSIIKAFGGDFNKKTEVYILDKTEYSYDILASNLEATGKAVYNKSIYDIKEYKKDIKNLKKQIKKKESNIGIVVSESNNIFDIEIISNKAIETIDTQMLNQAINSAKTSIAMMRTNIPKEELDKINSPANIKQTIIDKNNKGGDSMEAIMATVFPVFILPFFMLVIFLIQMIGTEINDEKSTRGMEIIISNVSPRTHFFSKVLAGNIFVISQALLLILYGVIGLLLRNVLSAGSLGNMLNSSLGSTFSMIMSSEFMTKLGYIIPLTLVLMLLTFIAYSLLAGILASMTTNVEDFNQMQAPLTIILVIGYYLAMMAGMFKGAVFIKILSYVPLISAILAPSLLVLSQISILDVIIAIIISILFNFVLMKYGIKVYKVGILNYSSKDLWKKVFKAVKE